MNNIETYDGAKGSCEEFLRSVENISGIAGWTDVTAVSVAMCRLKGIALEYLQMQGRPRTWPEFKATIRKRFAAPATGMTAFSNLISCQQRLNETVAEYAQRLQALGSRSLAGEEAARYSAFSFFDTSIIFMLGLSS